VKRILVIVGLLTIVVAVALVGYVAWFLRNAVSDKTDVRASVRRLEDSVITVEVVVRGTNHPVTITEISLERALQEAVGLGPPEGFRVEALPLEDGEKNDPEAVEHVTKYNREKVRYVGSRAVKPGSSELLRFSAARPRAASGEIRLQHERKVGVGGSIGFTSVRLAVP
jgi:hypothetical protein